jgi:hypothetical protein
MYLAPDASSFTSELSRLEEVIMKSFIESTETVETIEPDAPKDIVRVSRATPTPLGDLVYHLQISQPADRRALAGAALFMGMPIEQIITYGLLVVAQKVARTLDMSIKTESQIVNVMRRMNNALNIGLMLQYKTIAHAADEFRRRVINPLNQAIALGYRPGMIIAPDAWKRLIGHDTNGFAKAVREARKKTSGEQSLQAFVQIPCAMFFGDVLRYAREFAELLAERVLEINKRNPVRLADDEKFSINFFHVDFTEDSDDRVHSMLINLLTMGKGLMRVVDEREFDVASIWWISDRGLNILDETEDVLNRITVAGFFPVQSGNLPSDLYIGTATVESSWIGTQLLLTAIGATPDAEFLEITDYSNAFVALFAMSKADLVSAFLHRMEQRNRGFIKRHGKDSRVHTMIDNALQLVDDLGPSKSDYVVGNLFVRANMIDVEDSRMTPLGALTGTEVGVFDIYAEIMSQPPEEREGLVRQYHAKVDWTSATPVHIKKMLEGELVSNEMIAVGISKMPGEHQQAAMEIFKQVMEEKSANGLRLLTLAGAISIDEFIRTRTRELEDEQADLEEKMDLHGYLGTTEAHRLEELSGLAVKEHLQVLTLEGKLDDAEQAAKKNPDAPTKDPLTPRQRKAYDGLRDKKDAARARWNELIRKELEGG